MCLAVVCVEGVFSQIRSHMLKIASGLDQSDHLGMLDGDNGSIMSSNQVVADCHIRGVDCKVGIF